MKIPGWLLVIPALIALFLIAFFVTRAVLADDEDAGSNSGDFPGDLQQAFDNFESRRAQAQAEISAADEPADAPAALAAYLDYLRRFRGDTQELAQSLLLLEPPEDLSAARDDYVNASAETVEAIGEFIARTEQEGALGSVDPSRFYDAQSRQRDACFALQAAVRERGTDLDLGCGELSPATVAAPNDSPAPARVPPVGGVSQCALSVAHVPPTSLSNCCRLVGLPPRVSTSQRQK